MTLPSQLNKKLVLDNAPIHKSKKFQDWIKKWKKEDLYIWFLPKYSPNLNPIEILWRMIKYKWLPYEEISSMHELNNYLQEIIKNFGSKYNINFTKYKKVSNIFR